MPNTTATISLHRALLDQVNLDTPEELRLGSLVNSAVNVVDAPTRSYINDKHGKRIAILFVSNQFSPQFVARSVANSIEAKKVLGHELGSVILDAVAHGTYNHLSYVIWPLQREASSNIIARRLQKLVVAPRVFNWLAGVVRRTLCCDFEPEKNEALYQQPLVAFCENARYPDQLKSLARQALSELHAGKLRPITHLQHSDLWLGNILFPRSFAHFMRKRNAFYLIDWGGATVSGLPFFDMVRFAASVRPTKAYFKRLVSQHCELLECELSDAKLYLIVALANVGMKLEHFPEARYLKMCTETVDLLSSID